MKNSKVKNKRRTKTEKSRWFRRGFSITILIILLIFILILLVRGIRWSRDQFFKSNPKFEIQYIHYEGNKYRENRYREDLSSVGVTNGANLFSFEFKDIEEKINSLEYVENIIIERDLPNALRIKVVERDAVASIIINKRVKYIDNDGYVFAVNTSSNQNLPTIFGYNTSSKDYKRLLDEEVKLALSVIEICKNNDFLYKNFKIKKIDINRRDYFFVTLSNNIVIELPKTNIKKKLQNACSTIIIANGRGQKINRLKYRKDKFIAD